MGLHNPKGLLDLVGSTTNALERTKRLELLKTSGLMNKTQGARKSFSVKLNEATDRLELGLGGGPIGQRCFNLWCEGPQLAGVLNG